ncbi:transcriptional antiterminator bglG family domain protein [Escherichia coli DEC2B]|nr:transcriptional antiterminator bglG family domain protein [Escherichia coli DEC1B]EHU37103.1 transcriptional antiterminator bglG family domain protein [Escherichia coli DEC2B]EHU40304.1 transcriptional antiterminator bglG family domain protein [Escherichia coli DEC2C]
MDRRLSFLGLASVTTKNMAWLYLSILLTEFFMSEMNKKQTL